MVSDKDIYNYNKIFWLRKVFVEAQKLYEIGLGIGISYGSKEENMVERMDDLETKDVKEAIVKGKGQ